MGDGKPNDITDFRGPLCAQRAGQWLLSGLGECCDLADLSHALQMVRHSSVRYGVVCISKTFMKETLKGVFSEQQESTVFMSLKAL